MPSHFVFIAAVIVYILSPLDLIPDIFGPLARIDDLLVAAATFYYLRNKRGPQSASNHSSTTGETSQEREKKGSSKRNSSSTQDSPYAVLEIGPTSSWSEIQAAYKQMMANYHPDKVSHLGKELQDVAHEKTLKIQAAYETLAARHKS